MNNVLEWLEQSERALPHKACVSDPSDSLTFAELGARARSFATWLVRATCHQPRQAVALYLDKSPLTFAAMLGTVYAGGFYSVIDTRQPQVRVSHILSALEATVVLADQGTLADAHAAADELGIPVCDIAEATCEVDEGLLRARRAQALDTDPLYVNFTSGSTGTPKGVVVSHRSVIDFIPLFAATFGIGQEDVIANQAPFDFDVSVKDVYTSLCTGASMHLVPRAYFSNPTQLMDYLAEVRPTTLTWAVSALCFVSIMGGLDYREPASVRRVLFSGEVMPPAQLAAWQRHLPDATFANLYGPTEITCNCTYHIIDRAYDPSEVIPMGRPFPNERVLLLDEEGRLVTSTGVPGEVCVCGTCLALGYLGDPDRTAKAFVQNPLNGRWMETMYKTGDLAKLDDDGNLVFVARKDHQIKHLGQRIELTDIEASAQSVPGVEQACCLYDSVRKRLILCYVGGIDKKDLKRHLRTLLPPYMQPNTCRQLESFPLTKNGKIDRRALEGSPKAQRRPRT